MSFVAATPKHSLSQLQQKKLQLPSLQQNFPLWKGYATLLQMSILEPHGWMRWPQQMLFICWIFSLRIRNKLSTITWLIFIFKVLFSSNLQRILEHFIGWPSMSFISTLVFMCACSFGRNILYSKSDLKKERYTLLRLRRYLQSYLMVAVKLKSNYSVPFL